MLSLRGSISSGRRDFLRVGGLGLGGISLADMLEFKAKASENGISLRDKAVVFLFMHGGPPQAETFDPKMDCLLYTSPSPRDATLSRMPSSA